MNARCLSLSVLVIYMLGLSFSSPVPENDFFWYETEDGNLIKALLHDKPPANYLGNKGVEDDVQFWHYITGDKDIDGREIAVGCADCTGRFIKGAPLFIFAHGWGHPGGHLGSYAKAFRAAFAKKQQTVNFLIINWTKLSPSPNYGYSVKNVPIVGEYTARIINFLVEQGVASFDDIHFAGHSLGAHVANTVSQKLTGGNILYRVFALDPAMPLFITMTEHERISEHDAKSVVVIHTAMGLLGLVEAHGHVDFYPNSGKSQPGCNDGLIASCSHSRVNYLLAESIESEDNFQACECDSWNNYVKEVCPCESTISMGWNTPMNATGVFYLRTKGTSPFGI